MGRGWQIQPFIFISLCGELISANREKIIFQQQISVRPDVDVLLWSGAFPFTARVIASGRSQLRRGREESAM